jgi:hypothetical protein
LKTLLLNEPVKTAAAADTATRAPPRSREGIETELMSCAGQIDQRRLKRPIFRMNPDQIRV